MIRVETIGVIRSCFPEKFGIPRQAGLAPSALATIELLHPYNREEMVRGLETFSHLMVHFQFHLTLEEGWKATVRPPRLGGQMRLGVFATRSPHRPNHLGVSVVKLLGVRTFKSHVELEIAGVDLLDGTPVIDIKPYLPYCDSISDASIGWLDQEFQTMEVVFSDQSRTFCRDYEKNHSRPLRSLITEVLRADPRPASQAGRRKTFGVSLWDVNVCWEVSKDRCLVVACEQLCSDQVVNSPAGTTPCVSDNGS